MTFIRYIFDFSSLSLLKNFFLNFKVYQFILEYKDLIGFKTSQDYLIFNHLI